MIKCVLIILQAEFELSIASHIATPVIVKFLSKTRHQDLDSYISSNLNGEQAITSDREGILAGHLRHKKSRNRYPIPLILTTGYQFVLVSINSGLIGLIAMETKKARGVAKGVVTRKINEITDLMTDESNVDEVNRKANELKEAFVKFQVAHETFHSQLKEREAIDESTSYYDSVFDQVEHVQESVDVWLTGIETTRLITWFARALNSP